MVDSMADHVRLKCFASLTCRGARCILMIHRAAQVQGLWCSIITSLAQYFQDVRQLLLNLQHVSAQEHIDDLEVVLQRRSVDSRFFTVAAMC